MIERVDEPAVRKLYHRDLLGETGHDRAMAEKLLVAFGAVLRWKQVETVAEVEEHLTVGVSEGVGRSDLVAEAVEGRTGVVRRRFVFLQMTYPDVKLGYLLSLSQEPARTASDTAAQCLAGRTAQPPSHAPALRL